MPFGRSCHCPNDGCWEAYAGGWAIAERAQEAIWTNPEAGEALRERAGGVDDITVRTVHAACADGDPLATDQDCTQSGDATDEYLGIGMTGVVNAFNPERIVLGGGVIEGHPGYVDDVRRPVDERALQVAAEDLEIVIAELGGRAGVVGAATMARCRPDVEASLQAKQ